MNLFPAIPAGLKGATPMKWIISVLVALSFACGPEPEDTAETATAAPASITYCQPASWCFVGTKPMYFWGVALVSGPRCNAAIAAGTCTGNSSGVCWYNPLQPPGCYPR